MANLRLKNTHDIAYYAKDIRLTELSYGKRYEWQKMIELSKEFVRPPTDAEVEKFRIEQSEIPVIF